MRNPFKKKENNNNNTPFQGIASFFLRLFYLINQWVLSLIIQQ